MPENLHIQSACALLRRREWQVWQPSIHFIVNTRYMLLVNPNACVHGKKICKKCVSNEFVGLSNTLTHTHALWWMWMTLMHFYGLLSSDGSALFALLLSISSATFVSIPLNELLAIAGSLLKQKRLRTDNNSCARLGALVIFRAPWTELIRSQNMCWF